MIKLSDCTKAQLKNRKIESLNSGYHMGIKRYFTDGKNDYVVIDTDTESDSIDTIIVRKVNRIYGTDYFTYKGNFYYLYEFGNVLD